MAVAFERYYHVPFGRTSLCYGLVLVHEMHSSPFTAIGDKDFTKGGERGTFGRAAPLHRVPLERTSSLIIVSGKRITSILTFVLSTSPIRAVILLPCIFASPCFNVWALLAHFSQASTPLCVNMFNWMWRDNRCQVGGCRGARWSRVLLQQQQPFPRVKIKVKQSLEPFPAFLSAFYAPSSV